MPRISCHFPITVSVVGQPSAADLEELGRVVEEALADRFRLARRRLEAVAGQEPAHPVEAAEPLRPDRLGATGRVYRVPSYDGGGALSPVRLETAQPQPGDPALLSDAELEAEHGHARDWLLGHPATDPAYAGTKAYLEALEEELGRRAAAAAPPKGGTPAGKAPPAATVTAPPKAPLGVSSAVRAAGPPPPPPPNDRARRITAAHAGGAYGEHDLAFLLGERGFRLVVTASGPGAHRLTGRGIDAIAVHPKTRVIWLIDNKASGSLGAAKGESATALGVNLRPSLEEAVEKIRAMPAFEDKAQVLSRMEAALASVRAGHGIPAALDVKLKVTNAGGFAPDAARLPPGVEFEDLVGPGVRAAREADVAKAEAAGAATGRPADHARTEAMRRRVGGAMSRQPLKVPVRVRIARGLRSGGIGLAKLVGALIWATVAARIRQEYETRKIREWTEPKLAAMEPEIQARIEDRIEELVDLQLARPGTPLYAVVGLLTTVYRRGGGQALMDASVELTSVTVSAERVERVEESRVTGGSRWWSGEWQHDLTRTTYAVELEPFDKAELAAVLHARIGAEEAWTAESSISAEQLLDSQRRRDRLLRQLAGLGTS
ncbi:hypothetical protein ACIGZJ_14900 [Kitasatospora sp. NPDC052868]|uniref:hypothetical protein n=1 Tax=Kitasatospora sp. NPDC052868 TaxID=3364060 RepID=UPI0037C8E14B